MATIQSMVHTPSPHPVLASFEWTRNLLGVIPRERSRNACEGRTRDSAFRQQIKRGWNIMPRNRVHLQLPAETAKPKLRPTIKQIGGRHALAEHRAAMLFRQTRGRLPGTNSRLLVISLNPGLGEP